MSIARFDCIIWARAIHAKSIKTEIQTALACVAYKSAVDIKKLSFDDFMAFYYPIAQRSGTITLTKAIQDAQQVYKLLEGGTELPKKNILNSNGISNPTFAREAAKPADAMENPNLLHANGPQDLPRQTRTPLTVQDLIFQSDALSATDGTF